MAESESGRVALVTGATGFIGGRLCARLMRDGWRVHAVGSRAIASGPWTRYHRVDLGDDASVAALAESVGERVDAVFHLAGKAHALTEIGSDGEEYFEINTRGTDRLLRLAKTLGATSFVLAGTVKAMGEGGHEIWDESTACRPTTPYGRSKYEAERLVLDGGYVPHPVVLRLSMVYGGKERGNMTRMVDAVRRRRFPPFPETGNRRAMVHVEDVVSAFLVSATHPAAAGEVFIVTDGNLYSTREIYLTILRALGRGAPVWTPPLAMFRLGGKVGDVLGALARRRMPLDTDSLAKLTDSAAYSNAKITTRLGLRPEYDLSQGVSGVLAELTSAGTVP